MSHPRQVIRDRIRDVLMNQTQAGSRVFTNFADALAEDEKPSIVILSESEEIDRISMDNEQTRLYEFSLTLVHESDDDADDLAKEVELLLCDPEELEALQGFFSLNLKSANFSRDQKEDLVVFIKMDFEAQYGISGRTLNLIS